jgi:hypothetical protein
MQAFRTADSTASAERAGPGNIAAIKAFGTAILKASLKLGKAHADPGLVKAMGLAGTAQLAIDVGFPDRVTAGWNEAGKSVNTVGSDCSALGC